MLDVMSMYVKTVTIAPGLPYLVSDRREHYSMCDLNALGGFICYKEGASYPGAVLPQVTLRPCSHCRSCAGTVPICRISCVCESAMSAIKLDLISENLIRSREGSVFRHNYLCRNKCNVNTDYTYVGERWCCRLDIINFVHVGLNDSQSIYVLSIPFVKKY